MKKKYLFIEFVLFFLILVFPPLLVTSATPFSSESSAFAWWPLLEQSIISIILTIQTYRIIFKDSPIETKRNYFFLLSQGTMTLGLLMIIFSVIEGVSFFIPDFLNSSLAKTIKKPDSLLKWIHFTIGIFFSAFYEESLYRQFMPEVSLLLIKDINFKKDGHKRIACHSIELSWIIIFAASHRYLGVPAVINAFLCGFILRKCFSKTKNVFTDTIAHFLYNFILVIFYLLMNNEGHL